MPLTLSSIAGISYQVSEIIARNVPEQMFHMFQHIYDGVIIKASV